jgi:hypothetical protein
MRGEESLRTSGGRVGAAAEGAQTDAEVRGGAAQESRLHQAQMQDVCLCLCVRFCARLRVALSLIQTRFLLLGEHLCPQHILERAPPPLSVSIPVPLRGGACTSTPLHFELFLEKDGCRTRKKEKRSARARVCQSDGAGWMPSRESCLDERRTLVSRSIHKVYCTHTHVGTVT